MILSFPNVVGPCRFRSRLQSKQNRQKKGKIVFLSLSSVNGEGLVLCDWWGREL